MLPHNQAARELSMVRVETLKAEYEAGDSMGTIAKRHGVTRQRIHQLLTRFYPGLARARKKA